jgi:hypothetical protein
MPGGNPGAMQAERSWRADFTTVAAACNAVDGPPGLALRAVCEWFWTAPTGPIQSGRLTRVKANPGHLAKYVTRDLDAAYAWWKQRRADAKTQPEAGQ